MKVRSADEWIRRYSEFKAIVKHPSNKGCDIPDDYRERAAYCVATLIGPLTELALKMGYCLMLRGSQVRDIDLMAVPWESAVAHPAVLAESICDKAEELVGHAVSHPDEDRWFNHAGRPGFKPHGRLCWVFHLGGGPYIDLSVYPPMECQKPDVPSASLS